MRLGTDLLPSSLTDSPVSARLWLALAGGIGSGVCAYAGLYPRFDEGSLRVVIALTSAPFAAAVVAASLNAKSAARATGMTIATAALLGIASTLIPAGIITRNRPSEFVAACFFGVFFGAGTGVVYGLPLAILSTFGHRHVHAQSHEGSDRACRIAGIWLAIAAIIGVAGTCSLDMTKWNPTLETTVSEVPAPAYAGGAAALVAALAVSGSTIRLRRRKMWLSRVASGLEPSYRIRPIEMRDAIDGLPRLGAGASVIEYLAVEGPERAVGSAYRVAAVGTAVAIVDDMFTMSSTSVAPAARSASATLG